MTLKKFKLFHKNYVNILIKLLIIIRKLIVTKVINQVTTEYLELFSLKKLVSMKLNGKLGRFYININLKYYNVKAPEP